MNLTAPVRIDIGAGWPDSDPYRNQYGGYVLNAAINVRCSASLNGDLVVSPENVPSQSGLGTSGCLRALELAVSNPQLLEDKTELIKKVHQFENQICGNRAGFQDQAAAIFGGSNLWYFGPKGEITRTPVNLTGLEDHLVLVYTGSHNSGDMHRLAFSNPDYRELIHEMSLINQEMARDPKKIPDLIRRTWKLQRRLHPSIETPLMKTLQEEVGDLAYSCRAVGAGGGGCMIFYTDKKFQVEERARSLGFRVIDFKFEKEGIRQTD